MDVEDLQGCHAKALAAAFWSFRLFSALELLCYNRLSEKEAPRCKRVCPFLDSP